MHVQGPSRGASLISLAGALLILVSICPSPASAESRSRPGARELREAAALLRDGRCDAAIPLLRRAWEIGDLRNALRNLAECYALLERPGLAIEAYTDYLEHPRTSASDRRAANAAIARLRASAATVRVSSPVEGARVRIDGQDAGVTPLETLVGQGLHTVEVSSPGFQPASRELQIEPGEDRSVEISLDVLPAACR